MEPITVAAVTTFLAPYLQKAGEKVTEKAVEALFDSRKDLCERFTGLFRPEIISLGLSDNSSTSEISTALEANPKVQTEIGKKVVNNLDLLNDMIAAFEMLPDAKVHGITINAKNVGTVINNPQAAISLTNTFS